MNKDTERNISIIAGPCSAESREQLMEVAKNCSQEKVKWMRAGVWKPRTQPGNFEGLGEKALDWLKEAQDEFGVQFMTEAANPQHVEKILNSGLKGIWIGARTSVNPFYVQDIADALKGADVEVFVKNPINPDGKLWLGAIERVENAGVTSVSAIHRGFGMYGNSKFRNEPYWQIPIELMTQRPELNMFCDISHIAGNRSFLKEVAQKALDLNYKGLMVEIHPNPSQALSDKEQQITPYALWQLLENLVIRDPLEELNNTSLELKPYRNSIDDIDAELIDLLARRMTISAQIGYVKKDKNISILSPKRWKYIVERAVGMGHKNNLTESFIRNVFKHIHDESIEKQTSVMQEESEHIKK
jgi:chorismate mutase